MGVDRNYFYARSEDGVSVDIDADADAVDVESTLRCDAHLRRCKRFKLLTAAVS